MTGPGSRKPQKAGSSAKPSAGDAPAIAGFVRATGSVAYYRGDVPEDFDAWRQAVRRAAKALNTRVSVRRQGNTVWVINPDYEPSEDVMRAAMAVVGSIVDGQPVDFPTALRGERRNRLGVVRDNGQS